jgi:hypothetical protein
VKLIRPPTDCHRPRAKGIKTAILLIRTRLPFSVPHGSAFGVCRFVRKWHLAQNAFSLLLGHHQPTSNLSQFSLSQVAGVGVEFVGSVVGFAYDLLLDAMAA